MSNLKEEYDEKKLSDLKDDLGFGYGKELQKIMLLQHGKTYSISHIYKGLTVETASERVIAAALILKKRRRQFMKKVLTS